MRRSVFHMLMLWAKPRRYCMMSRLHITLIITDWPSIMANHGRTNMANHEPTIMANQNNQKFGAKMQLRERVFSHRFDSGIRIFDPMLFEDTVVGKIMEDFSTKCCVMNNEEKLFQ